MPLFASSKSNRVFLEPDAATIAALIRRGMERSSDSTLGLANLLFTLFHRKSVKDTSLSLKSVTRKSGLGVLNDHICLTPAARTDAAMRVIFWELQGGKFESGNAQGEG